MRFGGLVVLGLFLLAGCGVIPTLSTQEVQVLGVVEGTPESPTLLGRSLDLSGALVQDEWGQPRELLPGMAIEVQGRVEAQTLKASRVTVHSHLEGPVESVDLASASLSVLGRTVWVNANTRIYQKSAGSYTTLVLGDLRPGDWVEVSGTPDNRGNLIATYVERKQSPGQVELGGYACHLDPVGQRFDLYPGSDCASGTPFQVDYHNATVKGVPTEGVWVKVKGSPNGSLLTAREVHFYNASPSPGPSYLELKGPVANLDRNARTFTLMGYRVALDDATRYEVHGRHVTAEAFWSVVQEGNWVEAKGTLTGNTLLARKLELKR